MPNLFKQILFKTLYRIEEHITYIIPNAILVAVACERV